MSRRYRAANHVQVITERMFCLRPQAAQTAWAEEEQAEEAKLLDLELRADLLLGDQQKAAAAWTRHGEWACHEWQRLMPGSRPPLFYVLELTDEREPGESEFHFLERHKILEQDERRRVPKSVREGKPGKLEIVRGSP